MDHNLTHRARRSRDNDARVVRTRATLHRALLTLAERMPFAAITVTAIAQEAGIGYATFFRHYRDKQALLAAIAGDFIDELIVEMGAPIAGDTRAAALTLARFVEQRRGICHALLVGAGDAIRKEVVDRAVRSTQSIPDREPHAFPREMLISHTVAATLTILAWWLEHPQALDSERLADALDRLVLAPSTAA